MSTCGDIFLALLAIFFPPIAVWVKRGVCSVDSLLNILLLILGYIPGLLHAWYIIARYPEEYSPIGDEYENENGRVTYYYVSRDQLPPQQPGPAAVGAPDGGRAHRELQRGPSYGAINTQAQAPAQAPPAGSDGNSVGPNAPKRQQQQQEGEAAEGSAKPPPTYAEAIKGDNKIQGP